ncbi:MAG: ATP-binding protein [Tepidisphaeraceae bacterium]
MQTAKTGLIGIFVCLCCLAAQAADHQWKHVLVLHCYHRSFEFTESEIQGIDSILDPETGWIEQHVFHMDSIETLAPAYRGRSRMAVWSLTALHRWGIDESALPVGSIIANRPVSFYRQHQQVILGSLALLLVLTAIIWLQATAIARRRAAEAALLKAIRDRDETEQQLRQSQKMEAVGRLAGGVAHDFNNLLTAILGYTELAMDQCGGDSTLHSELEQISKAGKQAAGLTRQLLAFSRKQVIAPVVLDLNELVAQCRRMLERIIREDIELVFLQAPDAGHIKADPGQIEQIILNLAANARDAMPAGGKLIFETTSVVMTEEYVRTHAEARPGRWAMLAASDNGHGMTEAVRQHLFEPFYTTKERGRGTGLGLATVYGIVKQNGSRSTSHWWKSRLRPSAGRSPSRCRQEGKRCCWWRTMTACANLPG